MGVSATTTVNRTDYGMSGYQGMVGNDIAITIDVEFVQAAPGAKPPSAPSGQ
ncbi:MAG: YceI family protein [Acidobacteriaceae bacterium]|nr:YceI family protein [Acidobacteriaceae bacterium]